MISDNDLKLLNDNSLLDLLDRISEEVKRRNSLDEKIDSDAMKRATEEFFRRLVGNKDP